MSMPRIAPPLPFKYIGGDASVDLVNTVDWTDRGLIQDRLTDYPDLLQWAEGANLIGRGAAARLRRRAETQPGEARRVFAKALRLRGALHEVYLAIAEDRAPDAEALDLMNRLIGESLRQRRLVPASGPEAEAGLNWEWRGADDLRAPVWRAAAAAANLAVSADAQRLQACAGKDCGWVYVDRSRNGLRRWCAMDTCGGREKSRRHYAKVRG